MTVDGTDPAREWSFLGRRVLVISRFRPIEDGIARYADQLLPVLARGRRVALLRMPDGVHRAWCWSLALRVTARSQRGDDVLVHYHPHYFVQGGLASRIACYLGLIATVVLRRTCFVVHEPEDPPPTDVGRRGRLEFWLQELLRRAVWRGAAVLAFHSETERLRFAERFPARGRDDCIVSHGAFFSTTVQDSRDEARARLGLRRDHVLLLCIGFLSPEKPDKGFDRAIHAVRAAALGDVELHIVGSPIRRPTPEVDRYVADLRALARAGPGVHLHEGYVSDEVFDLWIRAADAVITPYRAASSSGVAARTHLLDTRLITSAAGGLENQLRPGDIRFSTDAELVEAIRRVAADQRSAGDPRIRG